MKKPFTVLILVFVLFTHSFGQKLMGEIYVGMPKKEFKEHIKANEDKYVIKTGIVNLEKIYGIFDEDNLISSIEFYEKLSLVNDDKLSTIKKSNSIKQYLVDEGCKVIEENNRIEDATNVMKLVVGNSLLLEKDSVLYGLNFVSTASWGNNLPVHSFMICLRVTPITGKYFFENLNKEESK